MLGAELNIVADIDSFATRIAIAKKGLVLHDRHHLQYLEPSQGRDRSPLLPPSR